MSSSVPSSSPSKPLEAHIDDDLDDNLLDDVLQDIVSNGPTPVAASITQKETHALENGEVDEKEFIKQLAEGMEEMMSGSENTAEISEAVKEAMAAFYDTKSSDHRAASPSSFQDRIKQTVSKLQDSSQQANVEMSQSSLDDQNMDGLMADMMKQIENLADSGDFESMLEGMMESLLSKDILSEPIRELAAKYPEYMERNKSILDPQQYDKYARQLVAMQEIIKIYDSGTDTQEEGKRVTALMTEIQELGQPPAELVKDLAPGMDIDEATGQLKVPDAEQKPPECNQM